MAVVWMLREGVNGVSRWLCVTDTEWSSTARKNDAIMFARRRDAESVRALAHRTGLNLFVESAEIANA